jgi:hypothetical protein
MKSSSCLILLFCAAVAAGAKASARSSDDTPEKLRARIVGERDLVAKARLEIKLTDLLLELSRKQYIEGEDEKGEATLGEMMAACEGAYHDLFATHRDPRSKPAGFKDTEIRLRDFARRLEDLKTALASDERPPVEKAIARLRDMHDDLLSGIMRVRKREER